MNTIEDTPLPAKKAIPFSSFSPRNYTRYLQKKREVAYLERKAAGLTPKPTPATKQIVVKPMNAEKKSRLDALMAEILETREVAA